MLSTAQIDELLSITALARRTAPLVQSSIHGELHWQAVARIGLRLSAGTPGAESHLVALFAILHDCRRENDGYDPDHGRRAAQLLHQLDVAGEVTVPDAAFTKLHEALSLHNDGETSRDPTIGVCWDADRLCLPRVGIDLDDGLLSTRAGLRAREWVRPLIHAPLDGWQEVLNGDRVWRWREELGTKTDAELVAALNREVGNPGWVSARGEYLHALRAALSSRSLDYSAVDGLAAIPGRRKFELRGRQLVYADEPRSDSR